MKLNIVQAVKLGTVVCLLAVTTQTIGAGKPIYFGYNFCGDKSMTSFEHKETKILNNGVRVTTTHEGACSEAKEGGGRLERGIVSRPGTGDPSDVGCADGTDQPCMR